MGLSVDYLMNWSSGNIMNLDGTIYVSFPLRRVCKNKNC